MTALALPATPKIAATDFRLERLTALNPVRGGYHQVVELGNPLWLCKLETTALSRALAGEYKWLAARLKPGSFIVELYDAARTAPLAYRGQAGSPWGTPQVTAISRTNSTITLSGLTAGAVISEGDYGAWADGPTRRLHICGAGVADGSGNLTIEVEPAPPANALASLPVAFDMSRASAEFILTEFAAPFEGPGRLHKVSLTGVQVLRRV